MLVGLLTVEQKDALIGQLVQPDWYFNPFHNNDVEYSWVISTEEIDGSIYPQNEWVKSLPLVEYIPPSPPPSGTSVFDQYFKN
jgi:hypothetical protein